jgi:hypothetical protein
MNSFISIFLILFIFISPVSAQNNSVTEKNGGGLFESEEILNMTLSFDIRKFRNEKFKDIYQDALLTYEVNYMDTITRKIKLKSRGEFRRRYCSFPPIRLNLRKNEFPNDIFGGVDKIKMVTHCNPGNSDHVLREYLVYKLYNIISDTSFRVRLIKINYIDTRRPDRVLSEYAFLIEPEEFLAKRTNSVEIKSQSLSQKNMKSDIIDKVALFNYMIGNYDWTVPRLHNLVILSQPFSKNANLGIPVPYDFDYSGIVNADYAIPPEDAPVESVRERLYLGICRSEEEFIRVTAFFLEKKEELYDVIEEFPYLRERSKKDMLNYLEAFYRYFDKNNTIVRKLLSECRN